MGQLHDRIHKAVDEEEDGIVQIATGATIYAVQSNSDFNDEYFIIITDSGDICAEICKGFRYSRDDSCQHMTRMEAHLGITGGSP